MKNSDISNHSGETDRKIAYGRLAISGIAREVTSIKLTIFQYHFRVTTHKARVRTSTTALLNEINCTENGSSSINQATDSSVAFIMSPAIKRSGEKESQFFVYAMKHTLAKFRQNKLLARSHKFRVGNTQYSW